MLQFSQTSESAEGLNHKVWCMASVKLYLVIFQHLQHGQYQVTVAQAH